jgi:hypothetical protein
MRKSQQKWIISGICKENDNHSSLDWRTAYGDARQDDSRNTALALVLGYGEAK